jgi:hypothetical protein
MSNQSVTHIQRTEPLIELCNYVISNAVTDFENYVSEHFTDCFSGISYEAWHEDVLNCDDVEHIYKTALHLKSQLLRQ